MILSWTTEGTYNTLREYTEGSENSVSVACDIQPNTARYIAGVSGDKLQASFRVMANRFTDDTDVPESGVTAYFLDENHVVLRFFVYQKYLEIFC